MASCRRNPDRQPKLTHHKASGQGVVRLNGKDVYCGPYGTPECKVRYLRSVAEWTERRREAPAPTAETSPSGSGDPTVNELALADLQFADSYYVKNGAPTTEARDIRYSIRPLRERFGMLPIDKFNPQALKTVREAMIEAGLCRTEVNKRTRRLVRMFAWGVEEGLVPPSVHWGLKAVKGLKKDRCGVRESQKVKPVPDAFVDAIKPLVPPQIWAMIELQRLTGMRPQEVTLMLSAAAGI
jgi:hypothetical protein